jgi:hypothetical protein
MTWLFVFLILVLALILGYVGVIAWFMPTRYHALRKSSATFRGLTGSSKMDMKAKPEENLWSTRLTTALMVPLLLAGAYFIWQALLR